jgi:hypothetical protein
VQGLFGSAAIEGIEYIRQDKGHHAAVVGIHLQVLQFGWAAAKPARKSIHTGNALSRAEDLLAIDSFSFQFPDSIRRHRLHRYNICKSGWGQVSTPGDQ